MMNQSNGQWKEGNELKEQFAKLEKILKEYNAIANERFKYKENDGNYR